MHALRARVPSASNVELKNVFCLQIENRFSIEFSGTHDDSSSDEKIHDAADITERRGSESDPVNLSLGYRERHDDDSNDGHIDVETIGNAPSKVSNALPKHTRTHTSIKTHAVPNKTKRFSNPYRA